MVTPGVSTVRAPAMTASAVARSSCICSRSRSLPKGTNSRLANAIFPSAVMAKLENTKGNFEFFALIFASQDQHRIAVAVETITLANRFRVGSQHHFSPANFTRRREGRRQHQQRRAWQMKICHQSVHD